MWEGDMEKITTFIVLLAILTPAVLLLCGCSPSQPQQGKSLDRQPSPLRPSYTDQASRILAEHTLSQISQQDQDYKLGPGDVIEINIFEWELSEKTKTVPVRIAQTGVVSLPMIGDLQASGRTVWELKKEIEDKLRDGGYIRRPQVSIIIKEFQSKKIAVVGAVREPGVYVISRNVTTLLDILSLAGGLSDQAGQMLYVIRRDTAQSAAVDSSAQSDKLDTITIDLHELMEQCDLTLNIVLRSGDIVSVPQAERFFVYGYVNKPGAFNLSKPTTVLEAVAMAQGVDHERGSPEYCVLKRRQQGQGEELIAINLDDIRKGKKPNLYLQPNDIVDVRQTWLKGFGLGVGKVFGGIGMGLGYSLN
jgi:polysaccharide export outer membrane protein